MKLKNIVKGKIYDYIEYRTIVGFVEGRDIFIGACKYENEELISLDGDSYSLDDEIIKHKEWNNENIKSGLTVYIDMMMIK